MHPNCHSTYTYSTEEHSKLKLKTNGCRCCYYTCNHGFFGSNGLCVESSNNYLYSNLCLQVFRAKSFWSAIKSKIN